MWRFIDGLKLFFPLIVLFLVDVHGGLEVLDILLCDNFRLSESGMIDFDLKLFYLIAFVVPHLFTCI
jgi:hypothetical protein